MDVTADFPVVALRTRGDLLDMDEIVVMRGWRLAIEGKCRRGVRRLGRLSRRDRFSWQVFPWKLGLSVAA
jgi:hypothetical protein